MRFRGLVTGVSIIGLFVLLVWVGWTIGAAGDPAIEGVSEVEDFATSGAAGTAPLSDGASGLSMTDVLTEDELNSEAELEAQLADVSDVYTDNDVDFITADDMADADHGDVSWSSGVASVEDLTISGETQGDVLYFNGSNWVRLGIGAAGQVLEVNAGGTAPEWDTDDSAAGGGNDVYIEEGDAARVDSTSADLYLDFDDSDFDVGVAGNEANITINVGPNQMSDADHGDVAWSGGVASVQAVQNNSVDLGTDTVGNYVATVADGTGIDGTASGEGSTYTPSFDSTELGNLVWGDNSQATISWLFSLTGGNDPSILFSDNKITYYSTFELNSTAPSITLYENDTNDYWYRSTVNSGLLVIGYDEDRDGAFTPVTNVLTFYPADITTTDDRIVIGSGSSKSNTDFSLAFDTDTEDYFFGYDDSQDKFIFGSAGAAYNIGDYDRRYLTAQISTNDDGYILGNANVFVPQMFGPIDPTDDAANTDDTAIQAAIDAAEASIINYDGSPAVVFLPPGYYNIDAGLTISKGIHLIGSGKSSSVIKSDITADHVITVDNGAAGSVVGYGKVANLSIATTVENDGKALLYMVEPFHYTIENVFLGNGSYGIYLDDPDWVTVNKAFIYYDGAVHDNADPANAGIYITANDSADHPNVRIQDSEINGGSGASPERVVNYCIRIGGADGIWISNTHMYFAKLANIYARADGVDYWLNGILVDNSWIEKAGQYNFLLSDSTATVRATYYSISNSVMDGGEVTQFGVYVDHSSLETFVISDNVIKSHDYDGIQIADTSASAEVVIIGNVIAGHSEAGEDGIDIGEASIDEIVISDNVFSDNDENIEWPSVGQEADIVVANNVNEDSHGLTRKIIPITSGSSRNVAAYESGALFSVNSSYAGLVTLTLPADPTGLYYTFCNANSSYSLRIDGNGADTIAGVLAGSASTTAADIDIDTAGACVTLVGVNSAGWGIVAATGDSGDYTF